MTHALPVIVRRGLETAQTDGQFEITLEGQRKTPVVLRLTSESVSQEIQLSKSKARKLAIELRQTAQIC